MKLGIFINTDRHLADVVGLSNAAVGKGHEVILFTMDDGTKVLHNPAFQELCKTKGNSFNNRKPQKGMRQRKPLVDALR